MRLALLRLRRHGREFPKSVEGLHLAAHLRAGAHGDPFPILATVINQRASTTRVRNA